MESEIVTILDDLLTAEIAKHHEAKVISARDLNALLNVEQMKDALGCDDIACAAEIGGALGTPLLVSGSASRLGGKLIIQLSLIDTDTISVRARAKSSVIDDESEYANAIRDAVAALYGKSTAVEGSRVILNTTEGDVRFAGTIVASNGVSRVCSSAIIPGESCILAPLPTGEAHITVSAPGHNPASHTADVESKDSVLVYDVETQLSLWQWMMYGGGAAIGVAGAASLAVGLAVDDDTQNGFLRGIGISYLVIGTGMVLAGRFLFDPVVSVTPVGAGDSGWFTMTPLVDGDAMGMGATLRW